MISIPNLEEIRKRFPSLQSGFAYLENAGGSQVPREVADAIHRHMLTDYVQLGAGYPQSKRATDLVAQAHSFAAEFVNCGETGEVILGPSSTSLIHMIASAYGQILKPGDEVIVAETNHEANAGAWYDLAKLGVVVKPWSPDPSSFTCNPRTLQRLLNERTKVVTLPHVSNIIGKLEDVREVSRLAHAVGAEVFCDGVAYAPHHAVDVQDLGVDWYVLSAYKVYGPHLAILFGKKQAFAHLTGPNHEFIPRDSFPYKWEPGGVSHEACAGFLALQGYFGFLAGEVYSGRHVLEAAFRRLLQFEKPVEACFRAWLSTRKDVKVIGPSSAGPDSVATISFLHNSLSSDQISAETDRHGVGIRHGNMYAVRLLDALNIPTKPGVVRISAVHYNTVEEAERTIFVLENLFSGQAVERDFHAPLATPAGSN